MVVLRSSTTGIIGYYDPLFDRSVSSSSSNSKRLQSRDVSKSDRHYPLDAEPRKERKYKSKQVCDVARPYAADALKFYNKEACTKYELVEPGYITSAFLRTCILHHVDFTAKKTDVTDAPEEMFFAELTTTSGGVRWIKFCKCMGPRDSISGDKNNGCCYCKLENVQHPKTGGFSRGGLGLFCDDSSSSSSSNSKSLRSTDVSDPDWDYLVGEPSKEGFRIAPRPYVAEAISVYNRETGTKYELVDLGFITQVPLETSILHHFNFTAKKTDVADAPEEMFFVELTTTCGVLSVKRCICIGPRDSISGEKNIGCCYCSLQNVQHPRGGYFSRGGHGFFLDC